MKTLKTAALIIASTLVASTASAESLAGITAKTDEGVTFKVGSISEQRRIGFKGVSPSQPYGKAAELNYDYDSLVMGAEYERNGFTVKGYVSYDARGDARETHNFIESGVTKVGYTSRSESDVSVGGISIEKDVYIIPSFKLSSGFAYDGFYAHSYEIPGSGTSFSQTGNWNKGSPEGGPQFDTETEILSNMISIFFAGEREFDISSKTKLALSTKLTPLTFEKGEEKRSDAYTSADLGYAVEQSVSLLHSLENGVKVDFTVQHKENRSWGDPSKLSSTMYSVGLKAPF